MKFSILTIGAGKIGAAFFKEMARFVSCYQDDNICMAVTDYADVKKKEIGMPYTGDDVEWNKAAILKQMVVDNLSPDCDSSFQKDFYAFNWNLTKKNAEDFWSVLREERLVYYKGFGNNDVLVIVDCGNRYGSKASEKLYEMEDNVLLLRPVRCDSGIKISVSLKLLEMEICRGMTVSDCTFNRSDALIAAHLLETVVIDFIVNKKVHTEDLFVTTAIEGNNIPIDAKRHLFVCVGTGGTGGDFVKEFAKELIFHPNAYLLMIDGDKVEDKNRARQPFGCLDLQQNKASILKEGLCSDFPELKDRLFAYPHYIEDVSDLASAISDTGLTDSSICLLGCVDNNRARQVMHMYFAMYDDIIYMDSGNEFDYGQVVTAVKKNGEQLSPTAGHFFHEMLTDRSPSASELSCGNINISTPQHQITNLTAADILYATCTKLLDARCVNGGITYFDVFDYMRTFRAVEHI